MKNIFLTSTVVLASLSFSGVAYACDMHGAYGFYMRKSEWEPYNPRVSKTDPAMADSGMKTPIESEALAKKKAKPNFSNAAIRASEKAKTQLAKKQDDKKWGQKAKGKKKPL